MQTKEQAIQDTEYDIPYHYIPVIEGNISISYGWNFGLKYVTILRYLLKKLDSMDFNTLIDVGCGDGRLLREISNRFPEASVRGVDYSERAIALAQALNPGLQYSCLDIASGGKDVGTFDIVTLIEVYEHIKPDLCVDFVQGLAALSQTGKRIIVSVPHINTPLNKKHFRHFELDTLVHEFSQYYEVSNVEFLHKRNWLESLISTLMVNKFFYLSNKRMMKLLLRIYERFCIVADESNCSRMIVEFVRI